MKKREYKEHKAVEPIPDKDWVGETWGLYWPDLEEYEELLHHPIEPKKHYDAPGFVPACDTCDVSSVVIAVCPKPKEKTPSPPPPPPPKVVLREEKQVTKVGKPVQPFKPFIQRPPDPIIPFIDGHLKDLPMYKSPELVNIIPATTAAAPLYEVVVHVVQIQKSMTPEPIIIKEPTPPPPPRDPTPEPVKPRSPTPPRRPRTPPTRQHYSPPPRPKVIPTSRRSSEARVVGLIKPSRREPRVIVPPVQKPKPVPVVVPVVPAPQPVKPVVVIQPKPVTPPTPVRPTPVSFYSKEKKPSRKPEPVLPPPPPEIFNKERDNSKWGWMKDNSDSGKTTRFRLSVYF